MSVATPFRYHQPFPFCTEAHALSPSICDNLTLAQVMSLWWNLEELGISISETGLGLSIDGAAQIGPFTASGDLSDVFSTVSTGHCSMWPTGTSTPSVREPRERVCVDTSGIWRQYVCDVSGTGTLCSLYVAVSIGASVDYPGMFAAYLSLFAYAVVGSGGSDYYGVEYVSDPESFTTGTDYDSFVLSIAGLEFTVYGETEEGWTNPETEEFEQIFSPASGLTASSVLFTYGGGSFTGMDFSSADNSGYAALL